MSEQTIQDGLYSIPVQLDKYTCRSLGATTIKDLVKNKEITGLTTKECKDIKANNEYTTLNSDMIKKITDTIPIPIKEDGTYDIEKQLELSAKYEQIESIIKEL